MNQDFRDKYSYMPTTSEKNTSPTVATTTPYFINRRRRTPASRYIHTKYRTMMAFEIHCAWGTRWATQRLSMKQIRTISANTA